jgi:hypothetical protein
MGIQATCPQCQESYNLRPEMRGKEVRCKKCAATFLVDGPAPAGQQGIPAQLDALQKTAERRLPQATIDDTPSSRLIYLPFVIAGAVLLLLCVGGGILVLGVLGIFTATAVQLEKDVQKQVAKQQEVMEAQRQKAQKDFDEARKKAEQNQREPVDKKQPEVKDGPRPEKAEAEPVAWAAKPDPTPFNMKGPFDPGASIPVGFMDRVFFPSAPSPFVAVASGKPAPGQILVYDLRQMQRVGQPLLGKFNVFPARHVALSPDGAYLADRAQGATKPTVEIWSIAEGRSLRKIEVDADASIKVGLIDFAGKDQLFTMKHRAEHPDAGSPATYQVWNIQTGALIREFSFDLVFHRKWGTLSPGQQYLAMEETETVKGYHLLVWDVLAGKLVGELELQGRKDPWGQAAGLAFSHDGEELAMLWRLKNADCWARILCWEVKTGKKLLDHKIGNELPNIDSLWSHGGPLTFQWLPDRSGWLLFGHLLVDRDSGKVVWKIDPEPRFAGNIMDRRFLDRDHITTLSGKFEKKLTVEALPRDKIDAAVRQARGQAP